jgi:peptide/nickel transport system substrate-binding protein
MRRFLWVSALAALALAAPSAAAPQAGGTYRVGWENSFNFTDNFDPTGEYLNLSFGILSNLVDRTLVGYDHVAGAAGNKLVPDIATTVPAPTDGGKSYTFHLRSGIKFGPPVNREVTSADVRYALERLANPKDGGEYGFYFTPIAGWDAYASGKAKTISGIQTPNASTIVFHLTAPTGDFPYRLALPAAGPIPHEVAECFEGKAGAYGRDVVSTGPYMIEGADKVDASSCAKLKPMSGYDGQTHLFLVRNPNYDAATDSKAARENLPDRFEFRVDANINDIVQKVEAGELDDEVGAAGVPPQTLEHYARTPSLRKYLQIHPADLTYYVAMNLTQPPFDDIHVRKAMNWILDKSAMLQAWGGPLVGKVANHIVPDTMFNNQMVEYQPYGTPGDHGSLAQAKAAMMGSKYDSKGDGTCSASACNHVLLLADTNEVDGKLIPVIEASAQKIGITFSVRQVKGAYPTLQTPAKNIPISEFPGWGKDYADPLTFFQALFDSHSIIPNGNVNYSLVGVTPAIAKAVHATGNVNGVTNVDGQLEHCSTLIGQPRFSCYESLDKRLMTQVVPWVPYYSRSNVNLIGPDVTKWSFDQFSGEIGYAHVAVK